MVFTMFLQNFLQIGKQLGLLQASRFIIVSLFTVPLPSATDLRVRMPCEPEEKKENPAPRCSLPWCHAMLNFSLCLPFLFLWDACAMSQEAVQAPCPRGWAAVQVVGGW